MSLGDAEVMDAKLSCLLGYQSRSAPSLLLCLLFNDGDAPKWERVVGTVQR